MATENNPHPRSSFDHLTKAETARVVNEVLNEIRGDRRPRRDFSIALVAALLGAGIAELLDKAIGLFAASGGYQTEVSEGAVTALFILIMVGVLFVSGVRLSEVRGLAEENDRRLAELDARLDNLRRSKTR